MQIERFKLYDWCPGAGEIITREMAWSAGIDLVVDKIKHSFMSYEFQTLFRILHCFEPPRKVF